MLAHIPIWVFVLFAGLLALGIVLSRPRTVNPVAPALVAVGFICYSLYGVVSSFGASPVNIAPWATDLLASVLLVKPYFGPSGMTRVPGTSRVLVPGSWLPMVLIMGIFIVKFAVGMVQGAHLPVGAEIWFAPVVCFVLGAFSGGFTARALNVHRYVRQQQAIPA